MERKLTHFATIVKYDAINVTGWKNIVACTGGGSVVVKGKGLEVYTYSPKTLSKVLNQIASR